MSEIHVGPPPPRSYARLWVSTLLLIVYVAFVLVVTMWPQPKQLEFDGIASRVLKALHNIGVPTWFGYDTLEFTANIAMFVPLGFLLGLALARKAWWVALFLIPAFSGCIEYVQGIALDQRVSTLFDVLANTIGGYIGLLLAMVLRAMIDARDRTKIERELWERRYAAAQLQRQNAERAARRSAQPAWAAQPTPVSVEPDPVTRVLDADFWASDDAPTERLHL
ncbi:VanZ family protein [Microbacterium sp.]|uniref:VanZ family protein n=1 Tax=Microbacterium sp. TaxID=51671 RepID=UPI0039E4D028